MHSSTRESVVRWLIKSIAAAPGLTVGIVLIATWVISAALAPWVAPFEPTAMGVGPQTEAPSWQHWFGTDEYGRDILSRVVHGGRYVLAIAPASTLLGLGLGTLIGLVAAYGRGWLDEAIMRLLDAIMAFPIVVLALLVLTVLGSSTLNVILVIGLIFAPLIARTARAAALVEVRKEYVEAARLRGEGHWAVMVLEVAPNIRGPLMVEGTIRLGYAVFTSATLGFLGLGVQPPAPDWGVMVSSNRALLTTAPWAVLAPALAIAAVVIGFSLIADGLRDRNQ
ncbi:ABC transporter permease [Spiribacter vilamensis]|uniref:Peptide/nickel transport system permease protein n=1 Tax=Spiribacter vilamensis TaxID=531306 RepID=A0A4Q8CZQ9_9GAMM|nr:ABC transporter permease [Spiribacter vilamensis]RZU98420.1 peptide/nickel transport system permease protein [Spiribacter vilamensis]TVO60703.1 ABC transporter permease [Spiribacter vilamensis]